MTTLLDEPIARVRQLPEAEQDRAAELLFSVADQDAAPRITAEQAEEVRTTLAGLRDGSIRVLADEEAEAMWSRLTR